jgi:hypothetical protein
MQPAGTVRSASKGHIAAPLRGGHQGTRDLVTDISNKAPGMADYPAAGAPNAVLPRPFRRRGPPPSAPANLPRSTSRSPRPGCSTAPTASNSRPPAAVGSKPRQPGRRLRFDDPESEDHRMPGGARPSSQALGAEPSRNVGRLHLPRWRQLFGTHKRDADDHHGLRQLPTPRA